MEETMRPSMIVIVLTSLMMGFIGCGSNGTYTGDNHAAEIAPYSGTLPEGNNEFALRLFSRACSQDESDNVFFSPFSISSAVAMTYAGSKGETSAEISSVMRYGFPPEGTGSAFKQLIESLETAAGVNPASGDPFTLSIANGLWIDEDFQLLEEYMTEMEDCFHAEAENLDFGGDPQGSTERINSWVAERTMDRITDLVPPSVITAETRLVLTNAVYFMASWERPFQLEATIEKDFSLADGSTVQVPTMHQTEMHGFVSSEGCSATELLYAGGRASMLIILPDGEMDEFQNDLDLTMLQRIKDGISMVNLDLYLPKFQFSRSLQLGALLQEMGMEEPFSSNADFSGITGGRDLFISEVLHKAFVKVDEAGTEAAAATAVVMNTTAMPPPAQELHVDRPFLFFILDRETDTILFMGRVMDPRG
jgi:serpin B